MSVEVVNRVAEYRCARVLTQEQLTRAVGVSRQSINSIERGRYIPSLPLALRFAEVFDCTVEDLFRIKTRDGHD
jgi:putative transcriptional regulator